VGIAQALRNDYPAKPFLASFWLDDAGRVPAQRDTVYNVLHVYGEGDEPDSALDRLEDAEARFGSYRRLIASGEFRFTARSRRGIHSVRDTPPPLRPGRNLWRK